MASNSRGPLEASVENYLIGRVKARGGRIVKIQGAAHWPDRLVILPYTPMALVELKRPKGGRLSAGQKELHQQLALLGCKVIVLWSKRDVDFWVDGYA